MIVSWHHALPRICEIYCLDQTFTRNSLCRPVNRLSNKRLPTVFRCGFIFNILSVNLSFVLKLIFFLYNHTLFMKAFFVLASLLAIQQRSQSTHWYLNNNKKQPTHWYFNKEPNQHICIENILDCQQTSLNRDVGDVWLVPPPAASHSRRQLHQLLDSWTEHGLELRMPQVQRNYQVFRRFSATWSEKSSRPATSSPHSQTSSSPAIAISSSSIGSKITIKKGNNNMRIKDTHFDFIIVSYQTSKQYYSYKQLFCPQGVKWNRMYFNLLE